MDLKKGVWRVVKDGTRARVLERDGRMGHPAWGSQNAVTLRASTFSGTLGPDHNWQSTSYPYAQLTVSLPEGADAIQDKLVTAMQEFADKFISENGLEPLHPH